MKYFRLSQAITILGFVLVATLFAINYLIIYHSINYHVNILAFVPYPYINYLMSFLFVSGTAFLTVGIIGIGRQHFKINRTLFTVLAAILVPLLVYTLFLLMGLLVPQIDLYF